MLHFLLLCYILALLDNDSTNQEKHELLNKILRIKKPKNS